MCLSCNWRSLFRADYQHAAQRDFAPQVDDAINSESHGAPHSYVCRHAQSQGVVQRLLASHGTCDVGRRTCWLLLFRLQEWRTEPALLPATVSGSPRTWLSRFPSRAPLIMPSSPDCTLCPGMLGRQELLEESCAGMASCCSPDSSCGDGGHSSPHLMWHCRSMLIVASASREAPSFTSARKHLRLGPAKHVAPMHASV